ncbi:MAG: LptA/OstA family protein [Candidatus Aminicenantales bacterium]
MRDNRRYFQAKAARWIAAAALAVILAVIAFHFISRGPSSVHAPVAPRPASPESGQEPNTQVGIEHWEYVADKGKIWVKADKFVPDADGMNHLEGNVTIIDYAKTEGEETTITADRVDYDRSLERIIARGRVKIVEKDVVLESPFFDYKRTGELFQTDQGVILRSSGIDVTARQLIFRKRTDRLEFRGDGESQVRIEVRPKLETDLPVSILADTFDYRRRTTSGRAEGNVRVAQGESRASGDVLVADMSEDEKDIKTITLHGRAKAEFFQKGLKAEPQTIEGNEVQLIAFPFESRIQYIRAKGGCSLRLSLSDGSRERVQAEWIGLIFSREGDLRDFEASGPASLTTEGAAGGAKRKITGAELFFDRDDGILRAVGEGPFRARIDSERTEIEADSAGFDTNSGDMSASGDIKIVLLPVEEGAAVGFFSKEKPLLVSCRNMSYAKEKGRFVFKETVRIWQDKNLVSAGEFEILEGSGEAGASGEVKARFGHQPKGRAGEERLTIEAARMKSYPGDGRIAFEGGAALEGSEFRMTSEKLELSYAEGGRELKKVLAEGKVSIIQADKEGRGERADYDVLADTVTLTGHPSLIDKEKGVTEGDKLTFYLADDRIRIENKEKDRSTTVIKS